MTLHPEVSAVLLAAGLAMIPTSGIPSPPAPARQLDVVSKLPSGELTLYIAVISPLTLFYGNLDRPRFEQVLAAQGPDYTIVFHRADAIRLFLESIAVEDFRADGDGSGMDLRYKFQVKSSGTSVLVFYATPFGDVLFEGRRYIAADKVNWLKRAVATIR